MRAPSKRRLIIVYNLVRSTLESPRNGRGVKARRDAPERKRHVFGSEEAEAGEPSCDRVSAGGCAW